MIQQHTCIDYQMIHTNIEFLHQDLEQLLNMSSECKDCEDHFCCLDLGQRTCPKHCRRQNCFCARCQLYQIEVINPAVYCQRCNFLLECYNYKHTGRIANRNSYVLERYCLEHCPTIDRPHREATTVDIPIPVPPVYPSSAFYGIPDYARVLRHVNPKEKLDVLEQGTATSQLQGRETPVSGPAGSANMGSAGSELIRRSSKRVLAAKITRRTRGCTRGTRRVRNGRS